MCRCEGAQSFCAWCESNVCLRFASLFHISLREKRPYSHHVRLSQIHLSGCDGRAPFPIMSADSRQEAREQAVKATMVLLLGEEERQMREEERQREREEERQMREEERQSAQVHTLLLVHSHTFTHAHTHTHSLTRNL